MKKLILISSLCLLNSFTTNGQTTTSNGVRIGIGVTAPTGIFHVDATGDKIIFEGLTGPTGTFDVITIKNDRLFKVSSSGLSGVTGPTGPSDADWFKANTTSTVPTLITDDIWTDGKVAVGHDNPATDLHIEGHTLIRSGGLQISDVTSGLDFTSSDERFLLISDATSYSNMFEIRDKTGIGGVQTIFMIKNDGQTGIGLTPANNIMLDIEMANSSPFSSWNSTYGINLLNDMGGASTGTGYGIKSVINDNNSTMSTNTFNIAGDFTVNNTQDKGTYIAVKGEVAGSGLGGGGAVNEWAGYFVGNGYISVHPWTSSDLKLKKDILPLENMTEKLLSLQPKQYNFKTNEFSNLGLSNVLQYGLIANEVKEIFPEIVTEIHSPPTYDAEGKILKEGETFLGMQYTPLIPVIIQGFKEQSEYIKSLEERILNLESRLVSDKANVQLNNPSINDELEYLEQNIPNPYSQETKINWFIPQNSKSAFILICNLNGTLINTVEIQDKGKSSIFIDGGNLEAGMYLYSLLVDNKVVDTKRMFLTK